MLRRARRLGVLSACVLHACGGGVLAPALCDTPPPYEVCDPPCPTFEEYVVEEGSVQENGEWYVRPYDRWEVQRCVGCDGLPYDVVRVRNNYSDFWRGEHLVFDADGGLHAATSCIGGAMAGESPPCSDPIDLDCAAEGSFDYLPSDFGL